MISKTIQLSFFDVIEGDLFAPEATPNIGQPNEERRTKKNKAKDKQEKRNKREIKEKENKRKKSKEVLSPPMTKVIGVAPSRQSARKKRIPTLNEVEEEIKNNGYHVDAVMFFCYYEAVGWKIGNKPIYRWKPLLRLWNENGDNHSPGHGNSAYYNSYYNRRNDPNYGVMQQVYTDEEIKNVFINLDTIDLEEEYKRL